MSNVKLSLTAISAALGLAIALQSSPVTAQAISQAVSVDALKATHFAGPEFVRHSWGLEQVSYDAPSIKLDWVEIRAQLEQRNAPKTAAQADARLVAEDALKGTEFDSPDYVRHSWGLEQVSFDAPAVKLTWSDINGRLANATVKAKSPAPQASNQPIPADALQGTQFAGPEFVRYSWGIEQVSFDAPAVRLNWAEVSRRLGQVNAGSSSESRAG